MRIADLILRSDLTPEALHARLISVLTPDPGDAWAVYLLAGRLAAASFELRRRGRIAVVGLDADLERRDGATEVRLRTRTVWSRHWPRMVNLAVLFGGVLALSALVNRAQLREFGLDVLVPLFSGIFTMLVIFTPAFWWMVARHAPAQSRWLLAYTRALLTDGAPKARRPP